MAVPSHITRRAVLKAVPAIGAVALPIGAEAEPVEKPDAPFVAKVATDGDDEVMAFCHPVGELVDAYHLLDDGRLCLVDTFGPRVRFGDERGWVEVNRTVLHEAVVGRVRSLHRKVGSRWFEIGCHEIFKDA